MKKEELGDLILASQETLYRVAKTLLYNDADCADAIQETIVKAFSKIHTLKKEQYAKTWLIKILINECYAIMRKEKKIVSLEGYVQDTGTISLSETESYSDLYEAIYRLPEQIKLVILLYYIEGYHVKEIAGFLDCAESAVKNRLLRGREQLKKELE